MAFDRLVFEQKQAKGKKAPELAEEGLAWIKYKAHDALYQNITVCLCHSKG
jgi:hypothetical protein